MKSVVNNGFAGRSSRTNVEMFDGTAARKLEHAPRVIQVDRRGGRVAHGDNRERVERPFEAKVPSFRDDMKFAMHAMGAREVAQDMREGSFSGRALPGVTLASVAAGTFALAAFGVLVMLL